MVDNTPYPGPVTWETLEAKWFEGRVFAGPSEKYDAEIAFEQFRRDVRRDVLLEAAEFVDQQRYEDNADDLRQVRDRLKSLAHDEQG